MMRLTDGPTTRLWQFALAGLLCVSTVHAQQPAGLDSQSQLIVEHAFRHAESNRLAGRLEAAIELLNQGQTANGLRALQQLLDFPVDSLIITANSNQLTSLKRQITRLFEAFPRTTLAEYERLYGPEAELLLKQAVAQDDPARRIAIVRRFFFTTACTKALDQLATGFLDRGQPELAAHCWWRLITTSSHRSRLTSNSLAKAWIALRSCGRAADAELVANLLKRKEISVAGGTDRGDRWMQSLSAAWKPQSDRDWRMPLGAARHNGDASATSPYLNPRWVAEPPVDALHPELSSMIAEWQADQQDAELPDAFAATGLVVGDQLLVRGPRRLRSLSLETGQENWFYDCFSSMNSALDITDAQSSSNYVAEKTGQPFVEPAQAFLTNSVIGFPTANGKHVFAIDYLNLRRLRPGSSALEEAGIPNANRLVAIPLDPGESPGQPRPAEWTAGGLSIPGLSFLKADRNFDGKLAADESGESPAGFRQLDRNNDGFLTPDEFAQDASDANSLNGHYFLGSPLPVDQFLYAITETDRQLNLVCLDADSGRLIWEQGIGFVRLNADRDPDRSRLTCIPAVAEGIVVCPTREQILVGLDAISGELLWTGYVGDESVGGTGRGIVRISIGHPGFPNLPVIDSERVVFLPRFSRLIHCLDLKTGRTVWKVPRESVHNTGFAENGDEYIAAVANGIVLVVGNRNTRGLSLADGRELWSTFLEWPAGRGIRSGDHYILPLRGGRVVTIDLQTGTVVGASNTRFASIGAPAVTQRMLRGWQPGNLVAAGRRIVSIGPQQIVAFDQAAARRDELLSGSAGSPPADPATRLELAQLDLALGRLDTAREQLEPVLATELSATQRGRIEQLLREILYLDLNAGSNQPRSLLERLDSLAYTPETRAEFLLRASEVYLDEGDSNRLLDIIDELQHTGSVRAFPDRQESTRWLSLLTQTRSLLARADARFPADERNGLRDRIRSRVNAALDSGDIHELRAEYQRLGRLNDARELAMPLIERLIGQGSFQQAELILLREIDRDAPGRERAIEHLIRLYDQTQLHIEAAGWLRQFSSDIDEQQELLTRISASRALQRHCRTLQPPADPVHHVEIRQTDWLENDPRVLASFTGFRSRDYPLDDSSSFLMLDKGNDNESQLTLIDRLSGYEFGSIRTPVGLSTGLGARMGVVGHYLSAVSRTTQSTRLLGLSMIERHSEQPLWSRTIDSEEHFTRAGPAGPEFAIFQYADRILCVDPSDGSTLWERRGIAPSGGLVNDPYAGTFGDRHALVMFEGDRSSYTVYETMTGQRLRRGSLEFGRRIRMGRLLMYEHRVQGQRVFRIWDPWTDEILLERNVYQPVIGRAFCAQVENDPNRLVMLVDDGVLLIWNSETRASELEVKLTEVDWTDLIGLRVVLTADEYLVCLKHQHLAAHLRPRLAAESESPDPLLEPMPPGFQRFTLINGELRAIDRNSQQLLWSRELGSHSILHHPFEGLPFLLTFVRQKRGRDVNSMSLSAIDRRTGINLGSNSDLFPDQPLLLEYDVDASMLQIQCVHSRIELDFSNRGRPSLTDEPLGRTPQRP